MVMPITVHELIERISNIQDNGIYYITQQGEQFVSYQAMYQRSSALMDKLIKQGVQCGDKVVLQIQDRLCFVQAFWACIRLGCVPVLFPAIKTAQDYEHLQQVIDLVGTQRVLFDVVVSKKVAEFGCDHAWASLLVDPAQHCDEAPLRAVSIQPNDLCLIAFTSGSAGIPKGVMHQHANLIAAIQSKVAFFALDSTMVSLSWMDMSHVGSIDFMVRDLFLGTSQVHSDASYIISQPTHWLDIVDRHKITFSFLPNFALGVIADACQHSKQQWDLSSFQHLLIGGELVLAHTIDRFQASLSAYGLPAAIIRPGLGMTETCAGCVFSMDLHYKSQQGLSIPSLGWPIQEMSIRVVDPENTELEPGQLGLLQLKGAMVTQGYYQNPIKNREAFTDQGWFTTGDVGFIDRDGLTLIGRENQSVIINGLNYDSQALENVIDQSGLTIRGNTIVFSVSSQQGDTEAIVACIVLRDAESVEQAFKAINRLFLQQYGVAASYLVTLSESQVLKNHLGKIKRVAVKENFLSGQYSKNTLSRADLLQQHAMPATSDLEVQLLSVWAEVFKLPPEVIGVTMHFAELGGSSLDIIRLSSAIEQTFKCVVSMADLFQYPTVARFVERILLSETKRYDPIVPLNILPDSGEPTVFFVPPILGEGLVFYEFAQHLKCNSYAFQARGYEQPFSSVEAAAECYVKAMRAIQPEGPYYLVGYSFGAFIMYEMIKQLEMQNCEVRLATVMAMVIMPCNYPDQSKAQFLSNFSQAFYVVVAAHNLGLIELETDFVTGDKFICDVRRQYAEKILNLSLDQQIEAMLSIGNKGRIDALGLTAERLESFVRVAEASLKAMVHYTFSGVIQAPLQVLYVEQDLGKWTKAWQDFSVGSVDFTLLPSVRHNDVVSHAHIECVMPQLMKLLDQSTLAASHCQ